MTMQNSMKHCNCLVMVTTLLSLAIATTDIYGARVIFLAEPHDIMAYEEEDAFISCDYTGVSSTPTWMITTSNGTEIVTSSSELPQNHFYNGSGIIIKKVDRMLNMTSYRCVLFVASDDFRQIINYTSTAGILKVIPSPYLESYFKFMNVLLTLVVVSIVYGICCGENIQFFSNLTAKFQFFALNEIKKHAEVKPLNIKQVISRYK